jgi:hypothetical protein
MKTISGGSNIIEKEEKKDKPFELPDINAK